MATSSLLGVQSASTAESLLSFLGSPSGLD